MLEVTFFWDILTSKSYHLINIEHPYRKSWKFLFIGKYSYNCDTSHAICGQIDMLDVFFWNILTYVKVTRLTRFILSMCLGLKKNLYFNSGELCCISAIQEHSSAQGVAKPVAAQLPQAQESAMGAG